MDQPAGLLVLARLVFFFVDAAAAAQLLSVGKCARSDSSIYLYLFIYLSNNQHLAALGVAFAVF